MYDRLMFYYGILCCLLFEWPQISQAPWAFMRSLLHTLIVTLAVCDLLFACNFVLLYVSWSCLLIVWWMILEWCINKLISFFFLSAGQSRDSLPEIVVDHERPTGGESTTVADDDHSSSSTSSVSHQETSTRQTADSWSPTNDYDYVLHKLHRQQQQQQQRRPPRQTNVSSVSY